MVYDFAVPGTLLCIGALILNLSVAHYTSSLFEQEERKNNKVKRAENWITKVFDIARIVEITPFSYLCVGGGV